LRRFSNSFVFGVCFLLVGTISTSGMPEESAVGIEIEPSKAWVGLATVHLEVTDLVISDGELAGRYSLRVPMRPSKNDVGTLHLRLEDPLKQIRESGGTLVGDARSTQKKDKIYGVICEVQSDGSIRIQVDTQRRVINFASRYQTISG
jgi:hypothetical protein